jgi:pimeloyl-ACP methyl ester carboxylesterase/predicted metalloprotease with PDZ domain
MNRIRFHSVHRILLGLIYCLAPLMVGCNIPSGRTLSVNYSISVPDPAQQRVLVRARFSGLKSGTTDLAMLRRWRDGTRLNDQMSWLQVQGAQGTLTQVLPEVEIGDTTAPDVVRWRMRAPLSGVLQIEYMVDLSGQDGAVPSQIGSDHTLLLARSLFIFPAAWLEQPQAILQGAARVTVQAPDGGPTFSGWPTDERGQVYLPDTLEGMLDGIVALGHYTRFDYLQSSLHVRMLFSSGIEPAQAERRARNLGDEVQAAYRFFGTAPDRATEMNVWLIVLGDSQQAASGDGAALAQNLLLVRTSDALPASLDQTVLRQAVRLWLGEAIRTAPPWATDATTRGAWLTQGWGEYLTWRIFQQDDILGAIPYWEHMRFVARTLAHDPALDTFSLEEATQRLDEDPALAPFVEGKGQLAALLLDERLRAGTQGQVDLGSLLQQMHYRWYPRSGDWGLGSLADAQGIADLLSEMAGPEYAHWFTQTLSSVGPLNYEDVLSLTARVVGETRTYVTPDGLQLSYQWLEGASPRKAIYLGDGPGRPPYDAMRALGEGLGSRLSVAYLDQRGSGRSDAPGSGAYSNDALINDIELLRRQLATAKVVLIGHGWGGYLALNYAARYPERVAALVLLTPIPSFPRVALAQLDALHQKDGADGADVSVDSRLASGVYSYADWTTLQAQLGLTGTLSQDHEHAEAALQSAYAYYTEVAALPEGLSLSNAEILPTLIARDRLLEHDPLSDVPVGQYPTLILYGERDSFIPHPLRGALCEQFNAETEQISQAGYYVYLDNPSATLAAIGSFLDHHP